MNSKFFISVVSLFFLTPLLVLGINLTHAAEHPGKGVSGSSEHPGSSPTNKAQTEETEHVSASQIRTAIKDYINRDQSLKNGYFYIYDGQLDRDWKLRFDRLHPVRKINRDGSTIYFACTDFKVIGSSEYATLDLDFWMKLKDGELEPTDIRIHKVDGNERFTYQDDQPVSSSR